MASIVESVRARPDDSDDHRQIQALASGAIVLAALAKSRPERCELLDDALPGKRTRNARRTRSLPFALCPEVALAAQISPDEFPGD